MKLRTTQSCLCMVLALLFLILNVATAEEDEESLFETPIAKRGELTPVRWKADQKQVDKYTYTVAIPPQLSQELRDFVDRKGFAEVFEKCLFEEAVKTGETKLFTLKDGSTWGARRPGAHWADDYCNAHWIDHVDEESYEEALSVLREGGFDEILDAIGTHYKADGLMITGMGFVIVSRCNKQMLHEDNVGSFQYWHDVLFPITLPKNADARLHLADDEDEDRTSTIKYAPDFGVVFSGSTLHGTADCDYRESDPGGYRVSVSVYVADLNDDNIDHLAGMADALFPVPGIVEWFEAQQGRLWGNGKSLKNDKGRRPLEVEDEHEDCPQWAADGECENDLLGTRLECPVSCKLFIDDERYFTEYFNRTEEEEESDDEEEEEEDEEEEPEL